MFMHFLTGIGLSMDAFSVSITNGICLGKAKIKDAFLIALFFGVFQGIMPAIGYFMGTYFESYIKAVDHWLAMVILLAIGLNMIRESLSEKEEQQCKCKNLSIKELFFQAVATSIDALAVGISFIATEGLNIYAACSIIAATTFVFSFCGVFIGKSIGKFLKDKAGIIGGCVLIFIGLKILFEHLNIF